MTKRRTPPPVNVDVDVTDLMETVNEAYGENSIMSANETKSCQKIPLRNPAFDYVSTGGIPLHQISEFVGRFSSTKTLHTYFAMREFQYIDWSTPHPTVGGISKIDFTQNKKTGSYEVKKVHPSNRRNTSAQFKYVAFIDLEGTFDKDFAATHGVNLDGVLYSQPETLEEAVEIMLLMLNDESVSLVVFDSMSALSDPDEADKAMDEHTMATNAKFWNKAMRKVKGFMNSNPNKIVTLILINSMYSKVGMVMGDPDVTRNGEQVNLAKALSVKFTALKEFKAESGEFKGETCGRNISLRNLKNKFGEPKRNTTFFFSYFEDAPKKAGHPYVESQIIDVAMKQGLITRKGSYYSYGDTLNIQGQDKFLLSLIETGDYDKMKEEVYASF